MTPQEQKAKELVNQFFDEKLQSVMGVEFARNQAKQHALISQNNTISILKEFQELEHSDQFWYLENTIQQQ